MPRTSQLQISMSRGEVTPLVHARIDTPDYQLGLRTCQNFLPLKYGGVTRIPGTLDMNETEGGTAASRLITFVFNQDQAYALEFSDQVIRFHTVDGVLGAPYEVVSPYLQADLWKIKTDSIGDVVYITCDGYAPRTLTRSSDTSWALAIYEPKRGPLLPMDAQGEEAWLTAQGNDHFVPDLTSNTAPSGTASASTAGSNAYKVFNRTLNVTTNIGNNNNDWVQFDAGSGNDKIVDGYMLRAPLVWAQAGTTSISWWISGSNDGTTWTVLDAQKDTSDWLPGEQRWFEIANEQSFRYYRYTQDSVRDETSVNSYMGKVFFHLKPSEQTSNQVRFGAVGPINGGDGFSSDDADRFVRVIGSDGLYRWFEFTNYLTTTQMFCKMDGAPLLKDERFSQWQLSAWGVTPGYPAAVFRHGGRLAFARTDTQPTGLWLSVSADYDNHGTSQPLLDDDAIAVSLTNGDMDEILWGTSNGEDILLGTEGGIRVVGKRDQGLVLSPTNIDELGQTRVRAGDVDPVWVGNILLFANKQRKRIYETAFSLDEGGYTARELTMLAEHLFSAKVKELHIQTLPNDTMWAVMDDGSLIAATYDRQQQVFGVTQVVMPGTNVTVESMCILPDDEYDVPMFVVGRTVNGTKTYRIEKMLDPYREAANSGYDIPAYLMSAARYTGASTTTITGLTHLEGESVAVYDAAGTDLGDATVSSGQITVPGGNSVTDALVGLRYTSKATTLRPPNVSEDGSYLDKPYVIKEVAVDVFETYGLKGGGSNETFELTTEADHANDPTVPALHSGHLKVHTEEGWDEDPQIDVSTDRAYPATIRSIQVNAERGV